MYFSCLAEMVRIDSTIIGEDWYRYQIEIVTEFILDSKANHLFTVLPDLNFTKNFFDLMLSTMLIDTSLFLTGPIEFDSKLLEEFLSILLNSDFGCLSIHLSVSNWLISGSHGLEFTFRLIQIPTSYSSIQSFDSSFNFWYFPPSVDILRDYQCSNGINPLTLILSLNQRPERASSYFVVLEYLNSSRVSLTESVCSSEIVYQQ